MVFSPLQVLGIWLRGLIAVALIGGSVYLAREWYDRSHVRVDNGMRERPGDNLAVEHRFDPDFGWNLPTLMILAAAGAMVWSMGGGLAFSRLTRRRGDAEEERRLTHERSGEMRRVAREDGTHIFIECDGPADAPLLVFNHGWGANGAEWNAVRPFLRERFRVVTWDEEGLGRTDRPADRDFSLDRQARDLKHVLDAVGNRRPVLVGHSIGGMILLELRRRFPEVVRDRVAGMVLAHTTYTNPLRTHSKAGLYTALQKPVIEPLLYATIALSPLLWGLNWLSYLNGSVHRSTARSGFSGKETREQLDFAARFTLQASPAVLARGTLGMVHWDASDVPATLDVPVLVVVGGRDPTTVPEAGERIAREVPGAGEMWRIEDAKHLGPIEFDREFARRVGTFADRCFASGPGDGATAAASRSQAGPIPGSEERRPDGKTAPDAIGDAPEHSDRTKGNVG